MDIERIRQHIVNVKSWHGDAPAHDCPSRTYLELAQAVEQLLNEKSSSGYRDTRTEEQREIDARIDADGQF